MKTLALAFGLSVLTAAPAMAAGFTNGGFEDGNTTGWTTGSGYRANINNPSLVPSQFLPGGSEYNSALNHSAVVGAGVMAHTEGTLQQVYSGNYSFRAEDLVTGGYASAITQTVTNYTDPNIFFAWAATLEGAHGVNDAATFKLVLTNVTTGTELVNRTYNAASGGGGVDSRFTLGSDGFYYTNAWQIEQLDVSAFSGDTFELTLLAADCQQTGHQGTVYLDGFGAVTPPPVVGVPEPETYALMLAGLGLVGWVARRRRA
jgi:hypothetical protein